MQQAFHSLSRRTQVQCLAGLARTALDAYPVHGVRLRLLAHFWNTTFRVTAPVGDQYVLRVHHRGQTSVQAVRSELLWLTALREDGWSVPEPVPNEEQRLVTVATHPGVPEPRLCTTNHQVLADPTRFSLAGCLLLVAAMPRCVLFRWIEGRFLDRGLAPSHLAQAGELMACLQRHAHQWKPPREFTRHRVDNLDPMQRGPEDHLGPALANSVLETVTSVCSPEAGRVIAAVISRIAATQSALGQAPEAFGLIHADLHHHNFLFTKGGIGAIDFDDCGFGHWLYDLAVPLTILQNRPAYVAMRQALLTGYRRHRPLPVDQEALLETFIALRRIQDLVGVIEEREHPAFRDRWKADAASVIDRLRAFTTVVTKR